MLILGVDPGSLAFGVGIVEKSGKDIRYVQSEAWSLKGKELFGRMQELWEKLDHLLNVFPLNEAAMEEGFLGKSVRSMSMLSMVRGVTMASMIVHHSRLCFYSPREIKLAMTGYGNAAKPQIGRMVGMLLRMPERRRSDDETDALAVAYCHAMKLP